MVDKKPKLEHNEVELTEDYLKQVVYWIINKFIKDSFHKQHNSSRNDLIGGFMDRWVNKIPEFLIFDKLLENKPYVPVTDYFLYDQETAKNAPDILGLLDDSGIYYPFSKFKNNRWDTPDDMPFVEMKVFRENHKLITIPARQFKPNRFYAIVVSHIRDDYITSIFDNSFFDKKYLNKLSKINEFIELDEGNQLLEPEILNKHKLGTYELLGVYKWDTLKDNCIKVGLKNKKPETPIYLKDIVEYVPENTLKLNSGEYNHFYQIKKIPIFINLLNEGSEINMVNVSDLSLVVEIKGLVKINEYSYSSGYYELIFRNEYHNAIKYYILDSINEIYNPIINQISPLFSGFLLHDGTNQMMISCDIDCDVTSDFNFVDSQKNSLDFEVNGIISIDDKKCSEGIYRIKTKADKENKKINSLSYRLPNSINSGQFNKKFKVNYPGGNFIFIDESSEDVFSKINIEIHDDSKLDKLLSQDSNKKTSTIFSIDGEAVINDMPIKNGFYKILFDERRQGLKKYYEFNSCTKVDNPILANKNEFKINNSLYVHEVNGKVVPVYVQLGKKSDIILLKKTNDEVIIQVNGSATIDSKELSETEDKVLYNNIWKLTFKPFERNSKVEEYVISKELLFSALESDEEELIKKFDEICGVN